MAQSFRDLCSEKRRRREVSGLIWLWARTLLDLVRTAFVERSKTVRPAYLVPVGLVLGLLIALVDTSPGSDDTGVSAAAVFTCSGLLGASYTLRARGCGLWPWACGSWCWASSWIRTTDPGRPWRSRSPGLTRGSWRSV